MTQVKLMFILIQPVMAGRTQLASRVAQRAVMVDTYIIAIP